MKILYIGNYRDQGSWGRVCRDYLLALIEAGADVVARPVFHTAPQVKSLDSAIMKVESKSSIGADICVQQVHHDQLLADTRFKKNIAIVGFNVRPPRINDGIIRDKIAVFDDVICTNLLTQLITWKLGDIVYPHPVKIIENADKLAIPEDKFVFYFIGKLSQRKNLDTLITAFHREFHRDEPVELLIKTSCDIDPNQAQIVISSHINKIKERLGKYNSPEKYKRETVMLNDLLDDNWTCIHNTGNCLVMPTYGEYTPLLPILALGHRNNVIINNSYGISDLSYNHMDVGESNEIYVEDSKCENLTNYDVPKGSSWFEISTHSLQNYMRSVYSAPDNIEYKVPSHKDVGEQLLGRILK